MTSSRKSWGILLNEVQESALLKWLKGTTNYLGEFDLSKIHEHLREFGILLQTNTDKTFTVIQGPISSSVDHY